MKKLNTRQQKALLALLENPNVKEAAKAVGVSAVTVFRYLQEAEFQEAYREARRETIQSAIGALQKASGKAVKTLEEVMGDTNAPASARVSAAKTTFEMSLKAVELEDLGARVERLEEAIKEQVKGNS